MLRNRTAAAYYEAGRAIALKDSGAPIAAASLDNAPRLRPASLRKIVNQDLLPPVVGDVQSELFARVVGTVAMERSGVKPDRKLKSGITLETIAFIHALAGDDADQAKVAVDNALGPARELVTWRWHAIERLAKALLAQRTVSSNEVAALLNAAA